MVADVTLAHGGSGFSSDPAMKTEPVEHELIGKIFDDDQEAAECLSMLFERDYFTRLWCVQEVVVPSQCVAKCEELELDFMSLLSSTPHIGMRRSSFLQENPLTFWNILRILKQHNHSDSPGMLVRGSVGPLLMLLSGTRALKATNSRDRVFSLIGISNEGLTPGLVEGNEAFRIDYEKNIILVYRDLARFMLRHTKTTLQILTLVDHNTDPSTILFPSWVPNWSEPRSGFTMGNENCFAAGLFNKPPNDLALIHDCPLVGQPIRPDVLLVDGYFVDRAIIIGDVVKFDLHEDTPVPTTWMQLFGTPFSPLSSRRYRNGELLTLALCKTFTAGPSGPATAYMTTTMSIPEHPLAFFSHRAHTDAAAYLLQDQFFDPSLPTTDLAALSETALEIPETDLVALGKAALAGTDGFNRNARFASNNARLYLTQNGYLGLGPRMMRTGDEICVLFGGEVPFVLRRVRDHHLLIGGTYIHDDDIMLGKTTNGQRIRNELPIVTYEIR
ncbi:MAG: hypothetical protein Q9218_005569 [Villophora microphyllina]